MKENYICNNCGMEVENFEHINQDAVEYELCEECFSDQYTYCDRCGEIVDLYEATLIEDNYTMYCQDCLENDNNVFYCDHHERYEIGNHYNVIDSNETICIEAIENGFYFECPGCLNIFDIDDGCWSEEHGDYYCYDCYELIQENNKIKSYHEHEDEYEYNMKKTSKDKNTKLYFGMELEIENKTSVNNSEELAEAILDITDNFVFENDGSLDDGFEIISYPFTRNYMKDNLEEDIIKMLKTIKNFGFDSLDTCGLHFHISDEAIYNKVDLVLFVEYYKEELTILSRRKENELSRWSKFYTEGMKKEELTKELIQNRIDDCWSRYRAINLDNFNTVEFRIFKGTTDHRELLATWELINNIVNYINDNGINVNNMPTFKEVATYKENNYISEYIENLGLEC